MPSVIKVDQLQSDSGNVSTPGRFGIANTIPDRAFVVGGQGKFVTNGTVTPEIQFLNTSGTNQYLDVGTSSSGILGSPHHYSVGYGNYPYIIATNGLVRLRIDGSGRVTKPYQPHYVGIDTSGTINTGSEATYQTVVHLTTRINTGSHMDTGTGVFTCPVAGNYYVSTAFLTRATAAHNVEIQKNGSMWVRGRDICPSGTEQYTGATSIVNAAAGDTIRIQISNGSGGDYYNQWSFTNIYLIG
jgi:hypothetical protein